MSVVTTSRTQRKDKVSGNAQKQTHATAEEIRLAQIISSNEHDEDSELRNSVEKIMEITGATEDIARTALYDANNDTNRAIELILENSEEQSNEWETAGRKKNKNAQTTARGVDTFDEEIKEDTPPSSGTWERSNSKGRGRGKSSRNRGKANEQERKIDDDSRGGFESRERQRGGRRGRGRGGSSGRGGRQPGRGPRRYGRYNQNRGEYGSNQSPEGQNDYSETFGTFTNSNTTYTDSAQLWPSTEEDWGTLEVGTWSNDDAQKVFEKNNEPTNDWGMESWNDDLLETKVFQSQNTLISPPISGSLPPQTNHIATTGSTPQMGERIDLGALFKKNHGGAMTEAGSSYQQQINNEGLMGQTGMVFSNSGSNQHSTPSVIQQLQQQGQSNSLFSDSKPVNEMESQSSRLFGSYERQASASSTNNSSVIGHYGSRTTESSFSQYNGKLVLESSEANPSALLGSFAEQFKSTEQGGMLGPMPDLTKSAFTSIKPNENQSVPATGSNYRNFSQAQQREATEAVKASLGLPPVNNDPADATVARLGPPGMHSNEAMGPNTLSFGAPQPARMPNKQRKKTATVQSKIPASAVEMPGVGSGGYHESSNFDLQFGMDDSAPSSTSADFNNANCSIPASGMSTSQQGLFNNNAMSAPVSLMNHITSGNMEDSSIFSSQMTNQNSQTRTPADSNLQNSDAISTSATLHTSQRFPESMKTNEPIRGPPGISHPQGLSTSSSSGAGLGALAGSTKQSTDLSSSGGSYGSGMMVAGGNMPMSGLPHESANDQTQSMSNPVHSFYTSSSLGQQSQQHMDHSNPTGRSLRSPVAMSSLPGSIQASPMPHITGTPSKDISGSTSTSMSSLTTGLAQSHITPHAGGTPTKVTSTAPISILGSPSPGTSLGGNGGYGSMNMGYSASSGPSMPSQPASTPAAASPGKHLSSNDLYSSSGLSSSLHHNHQQSSSTPSSTNSIGNALGSSVLPQASSSATKTSSVTSSVSKTGPPNLPLGVPPMLPNQYGIPMGPGLMTAYTPEALYGYTADPLMAVQSRVHQMPNYYDMYGANNPSANASSLNRESTASTSGQGKFGRGEPSSPTSLIGMVNSPSSGIAPQPHASVGQHNAQLKVSQTGTHQAQPFMNLPAAAPAAAYPGYSGLYYNAFQYPPMFAAATAVPNAPKHQVNTTTAFQQPATGFANAYSTASINVSSASNLHDIQGQGYNKGHVQPYEKQQAFHHHTNTPPPAFNLQTLTAAMAAANTGTGPGVNPYNQAPFMTMLPTHQHSQIHLHLPQHGDAGQTVGSQRSQASNQMGKTVNKTPFGNTTAPYWGN